MMYVLLLTVIDCISRKELSMYIVMIIKLSSSSREDLDDQPDIFITLFLFNLPVTRASNVCVTCYMHGTNSNGRAKPRWSMAGCVTMLSNRGSMSGMPSHLLMHLMYSSIQS